MNRGEGINCHAIYFSGHAIRRMFERAIGREEVLAVFREGDVIADYPEDQPYPSCLLLGIVAGKPLHVVVAQSPDGECFVVTAYRPDPLLWNPDFRTRK